VPNRKKRLLIKPFGRSLTVVLQYRQKEAAPVPRVVQVKNAPLFRTCGEAPERARK
jgi:hypothetical protein